MRRENSISNYWTTTYFNSRTCSVNLLAYWCSNIFHIIQQSCAVCMHSTANVVPIRRILCYLHEITATTHPVIDSHSTNQPKFKYA